MARCNTYIVEPNCGKSFNFSEYSETARYTNNSLKQDFISYNGAMYVCIKDVQGINPEIDTAFGNRVGTYWMQIIKGVKGEKGDTGKKGDSIIGPKGLPGEDGKSLQFEIHDDQIWIKSEDDEEWLKTDHLTPKSVYMPIIDSTTGIVHWKLTQNPESEFLMNSIKGDTGKSAYEIAVENGYKYSEKEWLNSLIGEPGKPGENGKSIVGPAGKQGKAGEDGREIEMSVINIDKDMWLAQNYKGSSDKTPIFNLNSLIGERGPTGKTPYLYKNSNGDLLYKYIGEDKEHLLIKYDDYCGNTIKAVYINNGYLYVKMSDSDIPINAGSVLGPRGFDGKNPVFRMDRYSTLSPEEKQLIKDGKSIWTGTHIQWKYDGENWQSWRNLVQINELLNIAISGIQIDYKGTVWAKQEEDCSWSISDSKQDGYKLCHKIVLIAYQTYYDEENILHINKDKFIDTLSEIYIPIQRTITGVSINPTNNKVIFQIFDPELGEIFETVDINFHEGDGIRIDNETNTISININEDENAKLLTSKKLLIVDSNGLKISKDIENHLLHDVQLRKHSSHVSNQFVVISEDNGERSVDLPDSLVDLEIDEDAYENDDYCNISLTSWNGLTQNFSISTNNWIDL